MNKNMRQCERVVRIVAGLAITSLAFWGPQSLWFLLGLILVASGIAGYCPLYCRLGIDGAKSCTTGSCCCKKKEAEK